MNTREGGVGVVFVLEMGGMWLYSYAVQTLSFGAAHCVRKMRTTAEQSALTRSQASLQPRFAWLSKVARRGENLVQYLKISLDIALDAKSFIVLGVLEFWESEKAENPCKS